MKKLITLFLISFLVFGLCACEKHPEEQSDYKYEPEELSVNVANEYKACFDYMWLTANKNVDSKGYGLVPDRVYAGTNPSIKDYSSMAAVGFALTAIPIGIENKWITKEEGKERVEGTIKTLEGLRTIHGFYFHFYGRTSAIVSPNSEVSIIDTAILVNGLLFVGEYFGGDIKTKANHIYEQVEWNWYYNTTRQMFYMGYNATTEKFSGAWDMYGEQLMVYVLAADSPKYSVGVAAYNKMKSASTLKSYGNIEPMYVSYRNSLFIHQFSHAWIDFDAYLDADGYDWYQNSVRATTAAYKYATEMSQYYKTFSENSWGSSACDGPDGYMAYGNPPSKSGIDNDGTVAPYAALASFPFLPTEAENAINYYATLPGLQSVYGLKDSFNLGYYPSIPSTLKKPTKVIPENGWYATDVVGIDKGIGLLMLENYRSRFVWEFFMKNEHILNGLGELGFTKK